MIATRIVGATLLALGCSGASAWGGEAHRVIADIARPFLDEAARRGVAAMLEAERRLHPDSRMRTLADAATWADEVRSSRPEARRWHFDDVPLCAAAERARYCAGGDCASAQIDRLAALLADRDAPLAERVDAFKYLAHFVGDIHQPLHAADNDDRGGNAIAVILEGSFAPEVLPANLHRIWDVDLPARFLREPGNSRRQLARSITRSERELWSQGTPADWIGEAHRLAREVAYGALPGFACGTPAADQPIRLGKAYYQAARPVLALQLKRAGVRLAAVLNRAFAP